MIKRAYEITRSLLCVFTLFVVMTPVAHAENKIIDIEIRRDLPDRLDVTVFYEWLGQDRGAYLAISVAPNGSYKPVWAFYGTRGNTYEVPPTPGVTQSQGVFVELREAGTHRVLDQKSIRYSKAWANAERPTSDPRYSAFVGRWGNQGDIINFFGDGRLQASTKYGDTGIGEYGQTTRNEARGMIRNSRTGRTTGFVAQLVGAYMVVSMDNGQKLQLYPLQ